MSSYTITCESASINLSPIGFRIWAQDFFHAFKALPAQEGFSPVPFFLCCRSIELALKALHLEVKSQSDVKNRYSHNLVNSYQGLDAEQKTLSPSEFDLLKAANKIYVKKEFEYFNVYHAGTGYMDYPDINQLAVLAEKLCAKQV